nr:MAG TPA: hypothetical protein [Caudoviricetes sp.]
MQIFTKYSIAQSKQKHNRNRRNSRRGVRKCGKNKQNTCNFLSGCL